MTTREQHQFYRQLVRAWAGRSRRQALHAGSTLWRIELAGHAVEPHKPAQHKPTWQPVARLSQEDIYREIAYILRSPSQITGL